MYIVLGGLPTQVGTVPAVDEILLRQQQERAHGLRGEIAPTPTVLTGTSRRQRLCTPAQCAHEVALRFGGVCLLGGIISLIVLGILEVGPAMKHIESQSAQCKVISNVNTGFRMSCSCGHSCISHYPCLKIQVAYAANGKRQTAYLYQSVYSTKNKVCLGVLIDSHLTWKYHISHVALKISKNIGIIAKLRHFTPFSTGYSMFIGPLYSLISRMVLSLGVKLLNLI